MPSDRAGKAQNVYAPGGGVARDTQQGPRFIVSVPVESNPVSFKSRRELRSSLLQCFHEVLLNERSQLRRALPGADRLLKRHQTGHVPLL